MIAAILIIELLIIVLLVRLVYQLNIIRYKVELLWLSNINHGLNMFLTDNK